MGLWFLPSHCGNIAIYEEPQGDYRSTPSFQRTRRRLELFLCDGQSTFEKEDFYDVDDKTDMPRFRCISSPGFGYLLKECTTPEANYQWISHEDAKLAREFWEKGSTPPPIPSGNIWKLHSIFGKTNDILSSKP